MKIEQLRARRTQLLREADGLRQDGAFPTDEARTQFAAKLTEVEGIDAQIRTLESGNQPATAPVPTPADLAAAREAAVIEERARVAGVADLCRRHGMDDKFAQAQIAVGASIEATRVAVLEQLATRSDSTAIDHRHTIMTSGDDARDKWLRGVGNWLLQRSGMAAAVAKAEGTTPDKLDPGEFRGLSLLDLGRQALERHGVNTRGMDRMTLAGQAMAYRSNYQTASDFAVALENVMHKVLRAGYIIQADTWSRWCGVASVSDFRAHSWYRTGSLTQLDDLTDHGEFKSKAIPDAEKATHAASTKGNIIAVTRQVIVNDDIGFVMRLTEALGRAGKLTIERAVYALLSENSGLGPTQADTEPLFHTNRKNVNATGSAITMAGLDADATVMAIQTDPNGQDILDLRPSVLLVARGLEGTARAINEAEYDPDTTGKLQKPNIVKGMFSDVVGTGRLTGNRRYLFADPAQHPVFLVSFLEGQREPVLETQDGWRVDGVEMKGRLDFGVDVVDYRGAVTNAGQ
ncbi:MAG: hypothetical protein Q8L86_10105 [Vicinamibacterales bacterium]|nr:hypothetical protein [Vicinamibacterales bacterium]